MSKSDDRGSITVEMCLVIPIVLFVVSITIGLFINLITNSRLWSDGYVGVYTCDFRAFSQEEIVQQFRDFMLVREDEEITSLEINNGKLKMCLMRDNSNTNSGYMYSKEEFYYGREVDLLASRLRRWQLYGDILQE